MEQTSSSSKVTVEYFDPYGVYQLLSPGLLSHLPLRNLHWESHAGPLRSIASLHIDLVPSSQQTSPLSTTDLSFTNAPNLSRVKSEDSTGSGDDGFRTQALGQATAEKSDPLAGAPRSTTKERRHQIPGLRQTPYLKVFLLRCDDNDIYKAQARRQVREWIKEHIPPSQSATKLNAQENHDAFEWLIVHVIVPNTAAATQPRTSGKGSESSTGSTVEKSATRWRAGSSTILDKLRADFNGSSKSAIDRVAQIRIGINDVPYDILPRVVPAIPGSYSETPQENDNAWLDLVQKFKSLILSSFDMRVSQYEEDIRERDAQRTLPGWNFCTFFMLKEGLARGFESVGLVEDALVGYDELAIGLDTIVREQISTVSGAAHGGSFLPYTEDLKILVDRARAAALKEIGEEVTDSEVPIDLQSTSKGSDMDVDEIPLNASKKRYRDLIMANNISIFDFRCYLFARQLSLLLRLANAWSSQDELLAKLKEQRESSLQGVAARFPASKPSDDTENLSVLGEVCKRSMDFVASISRIMRDDIWNSQAMERIANVDKGNANSQIHPVMDQMVDNIVSSFTFSVTQQILAQTSTKALPIPPSTLAPPSGKIGIDGQEPKAAIPEPKTMMHPARSSSLAIRSRSREPSSPGIFPGGRRASVPDRDRSSVSSTFLKAGLEELAAQRAELYLLSRNMLEKVGRERGWSVGWSEVANLQHVSDADMEEVDLDEKSPEERGRSDVAPKSPPLLYGISNKLLHVALANKDDYYRLYETLTDKALRHYTVANHIQSVQNSMTDLAILKYHLGDYAAAASYFYRMTPFYGESGWTQIELAMLVLYSKSLKYLGRKEEYVRVVLKLLSKAAMVEKERVSQKSSFKIGRTPSSDLGELASPEPYLTELLQITQSLQHEVQIPLQSLFGHVGINGTPRYHAEKDSVSLQLQLLYLLSEDLGIEKAKIKITPTSEDTGREVLFETDGPIIFKKGITNFVVHTNMIIPGTYVVSHISLYTNNVILKYDHDNTGKVLGKDHPFLKCPKLLIFHQAQALDVKLFASKYLHLDRNRSLEVEISSGRNDVVSGELHIRAATAGLRLQTSEAKVVSGPLEISNNSEAGIIRFGSMRSASSAKIRMPFNLEHEVNDISLKIEVSYQTERGDFFFATTPHMSVILPLGVNVQDVFKHKALFSRFTISSATPSPLRLLSSKLASSKMFEAKSGTPLTRPIVIYPRQSASMLYKITRLPSGSSKSRQHPGKDPEAALSLILHYICLEEEIDNTITQALQQVFKDSPSHDYIRLVAPTVLSELQRRLSPHDLERIAVLSEVSTSSLSSVRWRDHFTGLGRTITGNQDIPTLLEEELQAWQRENPNIPLLPISTDESTIARSRSIIIPVEVPSVTVVHTADLKLDQRSLFSVNTAVAVSNQTISASLNIKWTTFWDTEAKTDSNTSSQLDHLEFVYEVSGPTDTWLIGGKRKGHFKVPNDEGQHHNYSFPVVLIPIREGSIPYPNVEIRPAPITRVVQPGSSSGQDGGSQIRQRVVNCETDYKNAGEILRVISDAQKTTVSLDASGPQGGAWLLETERRQRSGSDIVLG